MTNLEIKHRLLELEARLKILESRQIHPEAVTDAVPQVPAVLEPAYQRSEQIGATQPAASALRTMCPKCGVKPAYFFHVKYCKADKNKNNGRDEENT